MSQPLPNAEKIPIVADALHSVRRYAGKTVVIKYGGNAMADDSLQTAFARDLSLLKLVGVKPIIVHGGAPQINETLAKLNIDSRFVNGLRHTDDETMTVVEMVLGGAVNQNIVRLINRHGGNAVGLTGRDGGLIQAKRKMMTDENGEPVDLGRVGTVIGVNPTSLVLLENAGFTPIIAPIGADEDGQSLNINADTVAAEVAIALSAEALFLLTNTAGVADASGALLQRLSAAGAAELIESGVIHGGMRPKVECALHAVSHGVGSCQIINGTARHALLLELFTDEGAGTFIEP